MYTAARKMKVKLLDDDGAPVKDDDGKDIYEERVPGDLVPEAKFWGNADKWIRQGYLMMGDSEDVQRAVAERHKKTPRIALRPKAKPGEAATHDGYKVYWEKDLRARNNYQLVAIAEQWWSLDLDKNMPRDQIIGAIMKAQMAEVPDGIFENLQQDLAEPDAEPARLADGELNLDALKKDELLKLAEDLDLDVNKKTKVEDLRSLVGAALLAAENEEESDEEVSPLGAEP